MLLRYVYFENIVILDYQEGILVVSREDFDRAFGCICSARFEDVKKDFALNGGNYN